MAEAPLIWLVGSKGMLGSEVAELLDRRGRAWVGTDRDVDITERAAIEDFAAGKNIAWIVNCAAYTAVDRAEDEPAQCRRINCEGPANLGALATSIGAGLVHISTDYVFDGRGAEPYREDDPVSPIGVYGSSKAEGEKALRAVCKRSYVLRTAWLYGRNGPNFVDTMLRLMEERTEVGVVADQKGSPTSAVDLATALLALLDSGAENFGIYHFTDEGEISWYDFAREIYGLGRKYDLLHHDCQVRALSTAEYPTKAHRPAYSVLSKDKIRRVFDLEIPPWTRSLERFIAGIADVPTQTKG